MYTNGCHILKCASDAAFSTFDQFIDPKFEFLKFTYVLHFYINFPLLFFPDEDKDIFCSIPTIKLHINKNILSVSSMVRVHLNKSTIFWNVKPFRALMVKKIFTLRINLYCLKNLYQFSPPIL